MYICIIYRHTENWILKKSVHSRYKRFWGKPAATLLREFCSPLDSDIGGVDCGTVITLLTSLRAIYNINVLHVHHRQGKWTLYNSQGNFEQLELHEWTVITENNAFIIFVLTLETFRLGYSVTIRQPTYNDVYM